jgi:hypothetical protein
MKAFLITATMVLVSAPLLSQANISSDLYKAIKSNDSLLFDIGFNTCNIQQFENLVSADFEFYHDEAGITRSKEIFIAGVKDGLCKLNYKPRRQLVENSMQVYPLKKNDVLYGVIQTGEHRFYAIEKDKPEYLTSTAKFSNLWLLENGKWKLTRSLSYDHKKPVAEK